MIPRVYTVSANLSLTSAGAAADLLLILPADDKPCRLKGWIIGQTSEVGDTAEEGLRITVKHLGATITNGTGGSAPTPAPVDVGIQVAAGFTTRVGDQTTKASSSGTTTTLMELGWINRATPWHQHFDEADRPVCRQTAGILVKMETTLADDMTLPVTFFVEEF